MTTRSCSTDAIYPPSRFLRQALSSILLLASVSVSAQTTRAIADEYDDVIKGAQVRGGSSSSMFGESVNLKDGTTSFSHVDVSVPTNSGLALTIGRSLGVSTRDADKYVDPVADGELFGNWRLDVPVMSGTFDERIGWAPQNRCSSGSPPPGVKSAYSSWDVYYDAEEYWHGNTISIPGKGTALLLGMLEGGVRPSDGKAHPWTTKEGWAISCIPLKNGAGEGFLVTLPDGTRYSFDWMSSRRTASLKDTLCKRAYYNDYFVRGYANGHIQYKHDENEDPGGYSGGSSQVTVCNTQIVVNRREYFLHATKVEDRFGNRLDYLYDATYPRRLKSVTSSDGGAIGLAYGANGKISAVSSQGRTWTYQYGQDASYGTYLTSVVQPDASRWSFNYGELFSTLAYDKRLKWFDCEPTVAGTTIATLSIGHPSGATGLFSFQNQVHGTDRTPGSCYAPDPDRPRKVELSQIQMAYKAASLIGKTISGPGMLPQSWSYSYQPSWSWNPSGYIDDCTQASSCNSTTVTEVREPAGNVVRSIFGNDYYRNAGQLQRVTVLRDGRVLQDTSYLYASRVAGQLYPTRMGRDFNLRNNPSETEQLRPLISTVIQRDGVTFTSLVDQCNGIPCLDSWGRPYRIQAFSSLGYRQNKSLEYYDNLSLWVLGQLAGEWIDGIAASRTEFNAMALPSRYFAFGKLQAVNSYQPDGLLSTTADAAGNTTTYSGWKRGIPTVVRNADNTTQTATVDDNGLVTSLMDENGFVTGFGYDVLGRLASVVYPTGDATSDGVNAYHPWSSNFASITEADWKPVGVTAGQWRKVETTGNHVVVTYYDAMLRPVLKHEYDRTNVNATLRSNRMEYDAAGHLSFESYPSSDLVPGPAGIRTTYDGLDRVVQVTQDSELGGIASTIEYLDGLRTRSTDPKGNQNLTSYMAWDKPRYDLPTQRVQPEGKLVQIARHGQFGWPLAITQRNTAGTLELTRRYVYDGAGQLCKMIEPETGVTVMGYDAVGNLAWSASGLGAAEFGATQDCQYVAAYASGRLTTRTYDKRNRPLTLTFADGRGSQLWSYTPDGLPSSLVAYNGANNASPVVTSYQYNRRRLLTSETSGQTGWYAWTSTNAYDAYGHLASQTYPNGAKVDYDPNVLGQPTKAGGYASAAKYYPNGALKQFTFGNGLVYTSVQNARQLPLRVTSGAGVSDLSYAYDANANIASIWDHARDNGNGYYGRWMSYDGLDRLITARSCVYGGDCSHRFAYDALDNLTSWRLAGVKDYAEYVYDAQNRLTNIRNTAGATVIALAYDTQGNVVNKNGRLTSFDMGNRLREVAGQEAYRYDALGRRVQTSSLSGDKTTLWQYGRNGQLMFSSDWNGSNYANQQVHQNVYLGATLVAVVDRSWPGNIVMSTKYQHTDGLGSPVAITNEVGQVLERNDYEPYGGIVGKAAYKGIGFGGHVADGGTGLIHMQQRYFDASIGRFMSADPLSENINMGTRLNRYAFGFGNPYRFVDPDGRQEAPTTPSPSEEPTPPPPPPCSDPNGQCDDNGVPYVVLPETQDVSDVPWIDGGVTVNVSQPDRDTSIRNPPIGQMHPEQADYYAKEVQKRVLSLMVVRPAITGMKCALAGCTRELRSVLKLAKRGVTVGQALYDATDPIEVPTVTEIREQRAQEMNRDEAVKLTFKVTAEVLDWADSINGALSQKSDK